MRFSHTRGSREPPSSSVQRPLAWTGQLVVEEIADEVMVYDRRNSQAHCLSSAAARVWRACDGRRTVGELSDALALEQQIVRGALEELDDCGLLDRGPRAGLTRREATSRLAKMGAAAASAPLIYSVAVPTPALAASPCAANGCYADQNVCFNCGCGVCVYQVGSVQRSVCAPVTGQGSAPTVAACTTAQRAARCGATAVFITTVACPNGKPLCGTNSQC